MKRPSEWKMRRVVVRLPMSPLDEIRDRYHVLYGLTQGVWVTTGVVLLSVGVRLERFAGWVLFLGGVVTSVLWRRALRAYRREMGLDP